MQSMETVSQAAAPVKVVGISDLGNLRKERIEKRQKKLRTIDDKFAALDEKSQRYVLYKMIGYIEASKDLILSRKRARTDEISLIFRAMEEMVDESWNDAACRDTDD